MTSWNEVVTTALLGTDRRPLPPELWSAELSVTGTAAAGPAADPAAADAPHVLLDHAARQRARARAAPPLPSCPPPTRAPDDDGSAAPGAAQELLGRLLARPVPELVEGWLSAASARGVRADPEHWTDLVTLAAARPEIDRPLLAQALGPAGRWFVHQNPAWARLAAALGTGRGTSSAGASPAPVPSAADVQEQPEVALTVPGPWPRALTLAALRALVAGQLGWRAHRYGAAVGARAAPADHDLVRQAAEVLPQEPQRTASPWGVPERSGAGSRLVCDALEAALAAAATRAEIERVFAADGPDDQREVPGSGADDDEEEQG